MPGVRREPGYVPLLDGWLNALTDASIIVVLLSPPVPAGEIPTLVARAARPVAADARR
ncbi:hypothetical protein [Blastococcus sp. LR1]|uniref:hypothetical protein n=1 Tax=Blastococcus sp. LR1 TaxID=2877000 RepID=UPI001CCABBFC|nr:hypothetical protein [Blastococcus sp. LR1]MCA0145314.1 hypothetical protein [Blastococcus sp. LR1]